MHALLPPVTMRRAWRVGEHSTQRATRVRQTSRDANNETLSAALHSRLPVGRRLVQVPRPFWPSLPEVLTSLTLQTRPPASAFCGPPASDASLLDASRMALSNIAPFRHRALTLWAPR